MLAQILHPQNSRRCPYADVLRSEVERLTEGIRSIMKDQGVFFVDLQKTSSDKPVKNANELELILSLLVNHRLLQVEKELNSKQKDLIHMAITEFDKTRAR